MEGHGHRNGDVDADHADLDLVGEHACRITIAGKDGGAVGVLVGVDQVDRFLVGLHAHHTEHGAEDLVLVDTHLGGDPIEQAAAQVETVLEAWSLHAELASIDHQARPFLDSDVDVAAHAITVFTGDERPHLRLGVGTGTDPQCLHPGRESLDQRIGGGIANGNGDGNRHAALAGRAVCRPHESVGGLVEVRIGHHHHVVLGATQGLYAFAAGRAGGIDVAGDGSRPDEAHCLDVGVDENGVHHFLVTVDHVEHASGQAGFLQQLGEEQRGGGIALRRLQDEGIAAGQGHGEHP